MKTTMPIPADLDESTHTPLSDVVRTHFWRDGYNHLCTPQCWCFPVLMYKNPDTGHEIWTHKLVQ